MVAPKRKLEGEALAAWVQQRDAPTEFPKMLYRDSEHRIVGNPDEQDAALVDGWFPTGTEAAEAVAAKKLAASKVKQDAEDDATLVKADAIRARRAAEVPADAEPTRAELEQKATELGLKFDGRTTDKKLGLAIAEKLKV